VHLDEEQQKNMYIIKKLEGCMQLKYHKDISLMLNEARTS